MSGSHLALTRPPENQGSRMGLNDGEGSGHTSWSSRVAGGAYKEMTLTLRQVGPTRPERLSIREVFDLLLNKLGIPPDLLDAVDWGYEWKIKVRFVATANPEDYMNCHAMVLKEGLRLEPTKRVDKETWVTIKRCNLDDSNDDILRVLELFGIPTTQMQFKTIGDSIDPLLKKVKHVKEPTRELRMKLFKSIPSYIMVGNKRLFVKHSGQVRFCARCNKPRDVCPGSGNANACEKAGGELRKLADVWDEVIGLAPTLHTTRQFEADYLETSGFEEATKMEVLRWFNDPEHLLDEERLVKCKNVGVWKIPLGKDDQELGLKMVMEFNGRRFRNRYISVLPFTGDPEEEEENLANAVEEKEKEDDKSPPGAGGGRDQEQDQGGAGGRDQEQDQGGGGEEDEGEGSNGRKKDEGNGGSLNAKNTTQKDKNQMSPLPGTYTENQNQGRTSSPSTLFLNAPRSVPPIYSPDTSPVSTRPSRPYSSSQVRAMREIEDIFKSPEAVALDLSVSKTDALKLVEALDLSNHVIPETPRPDPIGSDESDIFYDGTVSSAEKTKEEVEKEKKKREERKVKREVERMEKEMEKEANRRKMEEFYNKGKNRVTLPIYNKNSPAVMKLRSGITKGVEKRKALKQTPSPQSQEPKPKREQKKKKKDKESEEVEAFMKNIGLSQARKEEGEKPKKPKKGKGKKADLVEKARVLLSDEDDDFVSEEPCNPLLEIARKKRLFSSNN